MNWNAFAFFHSLRNFPLSKQYLKISFKGLQIKSQIFTILILIVSWPWALFGLLFLEYHHWKIQLLIVIHVFFFLFFFFLFFGVFFVFLRLLQGAHFFLSAEHCYAKKIWNISGFSLKSVINLSWYNKDGTQRDFFIIQKGF